MMFKMMRYELNTLPERMLKPERLRVWVGTKEDKYDKNAFV